MGKALLVSACVVATGCVTSHMQRLDSDVRQARAPDSVVFFQQVPELPHTVIARKGKRLIRLLGDELQRHPHLRKLGVDSKGQRRPAITGSGLIEIWDFLPLTVSRNAAQFTHFPHLTMSLKPQTAIAAITVPNGVKGGLRTKLREMGAEGFRELIADIETRIRPIVRRTNAKPMIYVVQRHFTRQRSRGVDDARLEADLRTLAGDYRGGVKKQPHWVEAIYNRANCPCPAAAR